MVNESCGCWAGIVESTPGQTPHGHAERRPIAFRCTIQPLDAAAVHVKTLRRRMVIQHVIGRYMSDRVIAVYASKHTKICQTTDPLAEYLVADTRTSERVERSIAQAKPAHRDRGERCPQAMAREADLRV